MNCIKCVYREYFKYILFVSGLLFKSIRNVASIKFASLKLIVFKHLFMAKKYHSPLMPLAAAMTDGAMRRFPFLDRAHLKCIIETNSCLIDTVEKLTHCNRVNGKLKVYDYGRYALTFYDSEDLNGIRAFVDVEKLKKCSALLYDYFVKTKNKYREFDNYEVFFEAAKKAQNVITFKKVVMDESFRGRGTGKKIWGICPSCGEASHLSRETGSDTDELIICAACSEAKLFQK